MRILVIGQGIAGTLLSYRLEQAGADFLVVDHQEADSSSKIASGLWNPVVLKRLTPVWRGGEAMIELHATYPAMPDSGNWFHELPIYRSFHTEAEVNQWLELCDNRAVGEFLAPEVNPPVQGIHGNLGFGQMKKTGYVDTHAFLAAWRQHLKETGKLREERLRTSGLERENGRYRLYGEYFDALVDCRGLDWAAEYPEVRNWFAPTKGEVMEVHCPEWPLKSILHGGVFVIPLGDSRYKIGATYQWDRLDREPTEEGRERLLHEWRKISPLPVKVMEHLAGVRPNVKDRRPVMGEWKPGYWVFNGLGSRGILHAPLLSRWLVDALLNGNPLPTEVDLQRFSAPRFSGA